MVEKRKEGATAESAGEGNGADAVAEQAAASTGSGDVAAAEILTGDGVADDDKAGVPSAESNLAADRTDDELDYDAPVDRKRYPANTVQTPRAQECERALARDRWETEAWTALVAEAQRRPLNEAQPVYERALHRFPTSGKFWHLYLEHLIREGRTDEAERRFAYALPRCYSIELCRFYLDYLRDTKQVAPALLVDAYEHCLQLVKYELASHSLWNDYINLLRRLPVRTALDEAQRDRLLRSALQRSVALPLHNLDSLWRALEQFEASHSSAGTTLAASPFHSAHIRARTEARARKNRRENLQVTALAVPPRSGTPIMEQARLWAQYLRGEAANLQSLEPHELRERLVFAHEQRLVCMYRMPDAWIDYAHYMAYESGLSGTACLLAGAEVLERALRACPDCVLVYLALARLYEALDLEEARTARQRERKRRWLREEFERRAKAGRGGDEADADEHAEDGHDAEGERQREPRQQTAANGEEGGGEEDAEAFLPAGQCAPRAAQVYERLLQNENWDAPRRIHAYIEYMQFARRTRGALAAREVFKRARHDSRCADADALHYLYIAAASVEMYVNGEEEVAKRIYELGLRHIPESTGMALAYVDFLWQRNDRANLRAVLSRLLQSTLSEEACALLLDRWMSYEARYGVAGLAGVAQVQQHRQTVFPQRKPTRLLDLLTATSFMDWVPLTPAEMEAAGMPPSRDTPPWESARGAVPGGVIPAAGAIYPLGKGMVATVGALDVSRAGAKEGAAPAAVPETAPTPDARPTETLSLEEGLARLVANLPAALAQMPPPQPDWLMRTLLRLPSQFGDLPVVTGGEEGVSGADGHASGKKRPGRGADAAPSMSRLRARLIQARTPSANAGGATASGGRTSNTDMTRPAGGAAARPMRDIYRLRQQRKMARTSG